MSQLNSEFLPEYEPRLVDRGGDLSKRWYIDYRIWDEGKECFVRKQFTGMNRYKSATSRRKAAMKALAEIKLMIRQGYTTGEKKSVPIYAGHNEEPADQKTATKKTSVEEGEINLKKFTLQQAITYFINYKNATTLGNWQNHLEPKYNQGLARISRNMHKNYKTMFNLVKDWLHQENNPGLLLSQFNLPTCNRFFTYLKEHLRQGNKTYNNNRGYLSTVLNYFISVHELPIKNPVLKIEHERNVESEMHVPVAPSHLEQIREYLTATGDKQLYLFIGFLYYTFTRPYEEVRLLRIGDIREKTIFIPSNRAKTNRGEHISIPAGLEKLIQEYRLRNHPPEYFVFTLKGTPGLKPVGEKYFYRRHLNLLAALDLDHLGYSVYGYKHTGALELYEMTKDILAVKNHCRHTSSSQTDTYLRKYGALLNEKAMMMQKF